MKQHSISSTYLPMMHTPPSRTNPSLQVHVPLTQAEFGSEQIRMSEHVSSGSTPVTIEQNSITNLAVMR